MKRVRQNEQARHRAVGFVAQLVAHPLHAFGRTQIDVDDDAGDLIGGRVGQFRRQDGLHVADRLKNALQLATLFLVVGRQQQAAAWGLS